MRTRLVWTGVLAVMLTSGAAGAGTPAPPGVIEWHIDNLTSIGGHLVMFALLDRSADAKSLLTAASERFPGSAAAR